MIVLLSVGDAMLVQSRDVSLAGGGELTALPEGIDVEALRTGGMTGMFFGVDRARFVTRQLVGGPRHADIVRGVLPIIDAKRVELLIGDSVWVVRASGELPTVATAAGAPRRIIAGSWGNAVRDAEWSSPRPQQLYDELDHFHLPAGRDTTWGEWHYFNVEVSADEWWYITYLVGGDVRGQRWGGQLLLTHRTAAGHRRFVASAPASAVRFDTATADLSVGEATVTHRDGRYRLRGAAGQARIDVEIVPAARQYFPAVELRSDSLQSGYVVPAMSATANGRLCDSGRCTELRNAPAYHDHNWGTWSGVTWEWGSGRGATHSLLYGGVIGGVDEGGGTAPFFLTIADSLGVRQVYRFDSVTAGGSLGSDGAPRELDIVGRRGRDTLRVRIRVVDAHASRSQVAGYDRTFLQMRGRWVIWGTAAGESIADSGSGFFETWRRGPGPTGGNPPH